MSDGLVSCPSPVAVIAATVMLSISTNAQQFSNMKEFTYFSHPIVSAISPNTGPVNADTLIDVRGAYLGNGSAYRCQFGTFPTVHVEASYVPGPPARVLCYSLASSAAGDQAFEISLNAQQYTANGHQFHFYDAPLIQNLSPNTGPVKGATTLVTL